MKHYCMGLEHGVQPNYHPSAHAVKSDYSLASQWVVPTSWLFSNRQMRMTAVPSPPPTLPHLKKMRMWICCILGKGSDRARWGFPRELFHTFNAMYAMKNREPGGLACPAKMDSGSRGRASQARSILGLLETSVQSPNMVAWIIRNFALPGLPDENPYKASVQSVNKGKEVFGVCVYVCASVCVCVCVCVCTSCFFFFFCLLILITSIPTKKNRVIRRGHNY